MLQGAELFLTSEVPLYSECEGWAVPAQCGRLCRVGRIIQCLPHLRQTWKVHLGLTKAWERCVAGALRCERG